MRVSGIKLFVFFILLLSFNEVTLCTLVVLQSSNTCHVHTLSLVLIAEIRAMPQAALRIDRSLFVLSPSSYRRSTSLSMTVVLTIPPQHPHLIPLLPNLRHLRRRDRIFRLFNNVFLAIPSLLSTSSPSPSV